MMQFIFRRMRCPILLQGVILSRIYWTGFDLLVTTAIASPQQICVHHYISISGSLFDIIGVGRLLFHRLLIFCRKLGRYIPTNCNTELCVKRITYCILSCACEYIHVLLLSKHVVVRVKDREAGSFSIRSPWIECLLYSSSYFALSLFLKTMVNEDNK